LVLNGTPPGAPAGEGQLRLWAEELAVQRFSMEKKSRKVNRRKEAIAPPPVNANGVVLEAIKRSILNNW